MIFLRVSINSRSPQTIALKHQMVQQSLKRECTLPNQDAKHRCIANTVSAKMVWTSRTHVEQQATKAALLQ